VIESTRGDLLRADVEAIVNAVNCVGVMGKGLALQFKHAYPENYRAYKAACDRGDVQPGRLFVFDAPTSRPRWVINVPTKRHWRDKSRLDDIKSGLAALVADVRQRGVRAIAIPPLGCGLGGLDWADVKPFIVDAFAELPDVRVLLFEPR
jgi:O-acetyl-ADP-ribose deacetylase (regulator of RNase III)